MPETYTAVECATLTRLRRNKTTPATAGMMMGRTAAWVKAAWQAMDAEADGVPQDLGASAGPSPLPVEAAPTSSAGPASEKMTRHPSTPPARGRDRVFAGRVQACAPRMGGGFKVTVQLASGLRVRLRTDRAWLPGAEVEVQGGGEDWVLA